MTKIKKKLLHSQKLILRKLTNLLAKNLRVSVKPIGSHIER
jgi:hypothetical protein